MCSRHSRTARPLAWPARRRPLAWPARRRPLAWPARRRPLGAWTTGGGRGPVRPCPTRTLGCSPSALVGTSPRGRRTSAAALGPTGAVATGWTVVVAAPAGSRRKGHRDVVAAGRRAQYFNAPLAETGGPRRLGRKELDDLDSLDTRLHLGAELITDLRLTGYELGGEKSAAAGGPRQPARSTTRRGRGSSARSRCGEACGGHATAHRARPRHDLAGGDCPSGIGTRSDA